MRLKLPPTVPPCFQDSAGNAECGRIRFTTTDLSQVRCRECLEMIQNRTGSPWSHDPQTTGLHFHTQAPGARPPAQARGSTSGNPALR